MFIFSPQIHLEPLKRSLSKIRRSKALCVFTSKMEHHLFDSRERLIRKDFGPEEGKIFFKHSFGTTPHNFCKISCSSEKYCQDVGQVTRYCAANRTGKGESCSYLKAMLNA